MNVEKEWPQGKKFLASINGLYYQEDDNKSWSFYLGETYYKFKAKKFDFRFGLLTETLGSGDKISFVDKLNSRRYHAGLANDYNRDKKEVPAIKTTYYVNKKMSLDFHFLPVFQASDLPDIFGRWATEFQRTLAIAVAFKGAKLIQESDNTFREQYHVAFNSSFRRYEIRYHYFRFKERLPVVSALSESLFRQNYPLDETFALDGNITLKKDFLVRYEFAFTKDKTYSSFADGKIGSHYRSNAANMLLGTDKNYKNSLYVNLQTLVSHIVDFVTPTPFQIYATEALATFQIKKGYSNETIFVELNGVNNFTTGEYILTPQVTVQKGDYLKLVGGVHLNGKSSESLGPIGQFDFNNTPYFETYVIF